MSGKDPLEDAAGRIEERAAAAARHASAEDAAATRAPAYDPEFEGLLASFLAKVPPESAEELVRRWREERAEAHPPRSGLLRRRQSGTASRAARGWPTEVVARGWAIRTFGVQVKVRSHDGDGYPPVQEAFVRHTVAVTTDGQLLLAAVREDGTVVVGGDASEGAPFHPSPRLGPLLGAATVTAVLSEQFPGRIPVVGMRSTGTRLSPLTSSEDDSTLARPTAHLWGLAEAMVLTLRDLGPQ